MFYFVFFFFFKQKTAYEMRISDWSSDVCSSDLLTVDLGLPQHRDDVVLRIDAAVFKRVLDAVDDAPQPLDAVERIRRRIGQMRRTDLAIFLHAAERPTQPLQEHHHRPRLGARGHEVPFAVGLVPCDIPPRSFADYVLRA